MFPNPSDLTLRAVDLAIEVHQQILMRTREALAKVHVAGDDPNPFRRQATRSTEAIEGLRHLADQIRTAAVTVPPATSMDIERLQGLSQEVRGLAVTSASLDATLAVLGSLAQNLDFTMGAFAPDNQP